MTIEVGVTLVACAAVAVSAGFYGWKLWVAMAAESVRLDQLAAAEFKAFNFPDPDDFDWRSGSNAHLKNGPLEISGGGCVWISGVYMNVKGGERTERLVAGFYRKAKEIVDERKRLKAMDDYSRWRSTERRSPYRTTEE